MINTTNAMCGAGSSNPAGADKPPPPPIPQILVEFVLLDYTVKLSVFSILLFVFWSFYSIALSVCIDLCIYKWVILVLQPAYFPTCKTDD